MIQSIGEDAHSVQEFIEQISTLEIDEIVVVIGHGDTYRAYGFKPTTEMLHIAAVLLERYANGDLGHAREQ